MLEIIIFSVIMIPFLIFAIVFSKGKGAFFIAGYNTMPDDEKEKYNDVEMCKFMGKIMYGVCFFIFVLGISQLYNIPYLEVIAIVFFVGLMVFTLVYMNTGNRFRKNKDYK